MSLLDELGQAKAKSRRGAFCETGLLLTAMEPADRADLESALADQTYWSTTIAAVLKARGATISEHSLQRHRRGACTCSDE